MTPSIPTHIPAPRCSLRPTLPVFFPERGSVLAMEGKHYHHVKHPGARDARFSCAGRLTASTLQESRALSRVTAQEIQAAMEAEMEAYRRRLAQESQPAAEKKCRVDSGCNHCWPPSSDRPGSARLLASDDVSGALRLFLEEEASEPGNDLLTVRDDHGRQVCGTGLEWRAMARAIHAHFQRQPATEPACDDPACGLANMPGECPTHDRQAAIEALRDACAALAAAYAAGAEDGEHPGTVKWEDLDAARALAVEALKLCPADLGEVDHALMADGVCTCGHPDCRAYPVVR